MAILGVEHTSYTVGDVDASVAFWTRALGFRVVSHGPWRSPELGRCVGVPGAKMMIAILEGHGHQLEFNQYETKRGREGEVNANDNLASHVAFRCDDIQGTAAGLVEQGARIAGSIEYLPDDPNDLCWAVYMRDPNGVLFELIEPDK